MNNIIDLNIPVAETIRQHPELTSLLIDLGFKPLSNPVMLRTVGAVTTLKQGARFIKLPLSELVQTLKWNGYEVKGDTAHDEAN